MASENRRETLLRKVISLLAEEGVEGLSFEALGKRAKMNRAHVAYYFKSKEELLREAVLRMTQDAQAATLSVLEKCRTPEEKVLGVVRGAFLWAKKHPEQPGLLFLLYHLAATSKPYRELHSGIRKTGMERLAHLLAEVPGRGRRPLRALLAEAMQIQAVISGNVVAAYSLESGIGPAEWEKRTITQVRSLLRT